MNKKLQENYQGEHESPDSESGAPAHDLKGIYPDDLYTLGARHYGDNGGDAMDHESMGVIRHVHNRPNRAIKVYRAVPKILSHSEKVTQLELEKRHYMRNGKAHPSTESKLSGSPYYEELHKKHETLLANVPDKEDPKLKINKGDWVSTSKAYAVDHGKSNLKNKYRILSKTVKAKDIFNSGDSIHEWGYHPQVTESTKDSVTDAYINEIFGVDYD